MPGRPVEPVEVRAAQIGIQPAAIPRLPHQGRAAAGQPLPPPPGDAEEVWLRRLPLSRSDNLALVADDRFDLCIETLPSQPPWWR